MNLYSVEKRTRLREREGPSGRKPCDRALVLGGGGVAAAAWELGVLAALAEAGVDFGLADLIVGTSAGALVAAQLAGGADMQRLYSSHLAAPRAAPAVPVRTMLTLSWMLLRYRDPQRYRIHVGRLALKARAPSERDRRGDIASRLITHTWPRQPIMITAIDASSGEFIGFSQDSDIPLVDAITASMAVPGIQPPVTIGGRRFIDGGTRSCANADLAVGYKRIIIIAPVARRSGPIASLATQTNKLRQRSRVVTVTPDRASRKAMGWNPTDPRRGPAAARAGHTQASAISPPLLALWSR
jgi:NTE family protein